MVSVQPDQKSLIKFGHQTYDSKQLQYTVIIFSLSSWRTLKFSLKCYLILKYRLLICKLTIYIIYSYTIGITWRSHTNSKIVEFYFHNNVTMNKLNPRTMENALITNQATRCSLPENLCSQCRNNQEQSHFLSDDVTNSDLQSSTRTIIIAYKKHQYIQH